MAEAAHALPAGTVTFLRSDIEGSMRLARALGRRYDEVNAEHQEIVRSAIVAHGGREVRTEGDAFFVVFSDASAAVQAAVAIQRAISAHEWPADADVRVRIGVHAGSAYLAGDDYGGFEVNRAARIAALGSGGQIVLSDPARALVADDLPPGTSIRVLGRHRLKDVPQPEALFQLDVAGLPTTFPALRSTDRPAGNLVARLTSFVGRDNELRRLTELLETRRLITLTGPGGTGKTSLAIEVARNASGDFPDGTWLVDLASVHDPALAKPTIARTLGLFDGTEGPAADRLGTYLADRTALLVLDNFEQILGAAPDVSAILRAAPGVKAIVTSRAPLRVAGEQEVPIGPLALGDGDGADGALGLFLDRARAVRPDFRLGPAETSAVAEICTLLDGLPLGLELAAARVSAMPVTAIRDRLAARLPLPGTAPRDLPDRQRTLDDAITWSYALLEPAARRVFDAIGVFEGSFDVEQAEIVCGAGDGVEPDVLGSIVVLAEQSLLTPVGDGTSGMRYRAFETTRAFALGRLRAAGEEDAIRERHAAAYLALG
ncbi:MAG: ATP-binding protein, partial [Chloroflexota bacterium]